MIGNLYSRQEPPESSKTLDQDFEDVGVLCTFLFNAENWISEHRLCGTLLTPLHHDQEPKPSQEPPDSSTSPVQDFEDMGVLCTFSFNVERWSLEYKLFGT